MRTLLTLALVLLSSPALADDHAGPYVGASLGMQQPVGAFWDDRVETGPAIKIDGGYRLTPNFALETSLYYGQGEHKDAEDTVTFMHLLTVDARFFPFGAGAIEPNFLVGYSHQVEADLDAGSITQNVKGYTSTVGGGVRFHLSDMAYVGADLRYMYVRYVEGKVDFGGFVVEGSLGRQRHGDIAAVMVGGGLQF